jgi:NAD(P)-dependent dehydrogenase (short-subunit alcohol dehydrogenase family)
MSTLRGKTAIVTGASSGVGKATAKLLAAEGARVAGIARGQRGLDDLRSEVPAVETFQADAADPTTAERLLRELRPELIVLAGGVRPRMAPLAEQTWETFSEPWNADTRSAFQFVKAALTLPLAPGSAVVIVSSGAAIKGSHLSGGYAGAKRMQWMLAGYAQQQADAKNLGLRFVALLPKQLIAGTTIADAASTAYGAWTGVSGADFMKRFDRPLHAEGVAEAIVGALRGDVARNVTAIAVTGKGVETIE